MKKNDQWVLPRHRVLRKLLLPLVNIYIKTKYDVSMQRFEDIGNRPYLILMNHQTPSDQLFLGVSVPKPVYYVATEDLFSNGFISKLITYLVNPIPIKKSTSDSRAVRYCMRTAKQGGSIAICPEGNRTYSGRTETIKPSISKLCKALRLPIVFFIISGGFGSEPRFSNKIRRGKMSTTFKHVIEYDDYKDLSDDELYDIIIKELYHDDTTLSREGAVFKSDHSAEYIERILFVCPKCGLSEFKSEGTHFHCTKCGKSYSYNSDLSITEDKCSDNEFKIKYLKDWYDLQVDYINSLDMISLKDEIIYSDICSLKEVIPYERKQLISDKCKVKVLGNRLEFDMDSTSKCISFDDITSMAVMGRNKLNVYTDTIYQLKGNLRFNAVKYMYLYYRYKNQTNGGNDNDEFLGL